MQTYTGNILECVSVDVTCGVRGLDDKKVNQDSHGNAGKESNSVNST